MLNVAVVGLGWWGRTIVTTLKDSAKLRAFAGVDTDPKAGEWARGQGLAFHPTLDAALADSSVGGIVLCTPHSFHTAQIAAAASASKHVFCEKPLALTRAAAVESVALCKRQGVVLGVGHERRFEPPMQELVGLAKSGALGTLLQIEASFCQNKLMNLPAENWRQSEREAPAGPMTATGIHLLDLAVSLFGPAESALARNRRLGSQLANGDTLAALVSFRNGGALLLNAILATPFAGRFTLYGSQGWVELRDRAHPESPQGWTLTRCAVDGTTTSADYPPAPAVRTNLEAWADAAAGGAPYPVTPEEMIATAAALEAIVKSAASGTVAAVA